MLNLWSTIPMLADVDSIVKLKVEIFIKLA
jgi:hypothetical protein